MPRGERREAECQGRDNAERMVGGIVKAPVKEFWWGGGGKNEEGDQEEE